MDGSRKRYKTMHRGSHRGNGSRRVGQIAKTMQYMLDNRAKPDIIGEKVENEYYDSDRGKGPIMRRLEDSQRENLTKFEYNLTPDFINKHVGGNNASRAECVQIAKDRNVKNSTLIRAGKDAIEDKAKKIIQANGNCYASNEGNYGDQLTVCFSAKEFQLMTINNDGEAAQGWHEEALGITGKWRGSLIEGNHFEAGGKNYENNAEVDGSAEKGRKKKGKKK